MAPNTSPATFSEAVQVSGQEGIACEIRARRGEVQGEQWRVYILHDDGY